MTFCALKKILYNPAPGTRDPLLSSDGFDFLLSWLGLGGGESDTRLSHAEPGSEPSENAKAVRAGGEKPSPPPPALTASLPSYHRNPVPSSCLCQT